jgi:SAM-dependent methyltransferase
MKEIKVEGEETNRKGNLSEFQYNKRYGIYELPMKIKNNYSFNYSDGIEKEDYILQSIKKAKDITDDSEELMKMAKDWPSYYHLGIGRSNILKALDLPYNVKILELGSGCGALTRYLGEKHESVDGIEGSSERAQIAYERCRDLKNVKIFCSDFNRVKFNNSYDIVTLIGVLEYSPKYCLNQLDSIDACLMLLKHVKSALKEDGILILAIENKIGIKYWSGCPEDHTGKIFDGIHGYPEGKGVKTFSKKELNSLLEKAGFLNISFYSCFPDYKFASTIFSDIEDEKDFYLHNWVETPFASHNISRSYTFHEGLAIKALSKSGLLREFTNSFLVVASKSENNIVSKPDWIAKRFSTQRRKEFQCITTLKINPEIYIEKKKIINDKDYIIKNNSYKIKHKAMNSPWHDGDLLIFEIYKMSICKDYKKKLLKILNLYYQELFNRYYIGSNDEEDYPLLKGESIDFIFRNIIKANNKILPIDNEWFTENPIPADYVMYRAVIIDIVGSQFPWIDKKIKNVDNFAVELIKSIFPNYGNRRNNKNKLIEKSFQNGVTNGLNQINLLPNYYFLRNKIIRRITLKIWNKILPGRIKTLIIRLFLKKSNKSSFMPKS